jgi:two-component system cell cycle sensor histidine kinase/response regulator CckA
MTRAPTFDEIFAVMSAASVGDAEARVPLPEEPDLTDAATRFAIALNILLDDLACRVAEREKAEEHLRHSQKMEAIGKLAGGIAHDFNNLLSVVLGYTDLMLAEGQVVDSIRADLAEVRRAGERARELTQQLLAFSRRQMLEPKVLDLNGVLHGMEKMLRRLLGESIELSLLTFTPLQPIKADPGQLEQVVMNLAINARDAMPEGGKLAFETANVELDSAYAVQHPEVVPGPYVMLAVSDTGVGMTAEVRARIFEPFFTTKEQGRGTGLGLATVFGIVRQSGGHLWVYSEPDLGTTFKIYLPQTRSTTEAPPPMEPVASPTLRGSETVLLVEDEAQVRSLVRVVLGKNGYNVLEAQNSGEALLISEQFPAAIQLLLTDVVMPHVSGKKLADRLQLERADLKVLYMSGYADGSVVHHGVLDAGISFLQKPITPDTLLHAVRAVLDAP